MVEREEVSRWKNEMMYYTQRDCLDALVKYFIMILSIFTHTCYTAVSLLSV